MKATIEQLAQISLFAILNTKDLEHLQSYTHIQFYQRKEIILHEGDRLPERLHILLTGVLQVKKSATTGKETILRTLREGEIFAAPALFGDRYAPATVVVIEDCQILTIARVNLLKTIEQTPELALEILVIFNQRLQQLHNMVHGLVSERAVVRLARLIQYAVWQYGTEITPAGEQLRIKLPYYQIARSIGITYEECIRLMKGLNDTIQYSRGGKIMILHRDALEAIASGETEVDIIC
ncbi:MAG: Crp/Fnr family transcriptional regulator [Cyanobacteria bacterium P01_A01_bin.84]